MLPVVTTPAPVQASAQDTYIGTLPDGREHQTIVLENDQFDTMYGHTVSAGFAIEGFWHRNGKSNNGSFSAIKGIAVTCILTSGKRQLIVAGLDAGRTNSAAFVGVRRFS